MKISVNDKELLTLTETQKKVLQNDILSETFDEDMNRRLEYVISHKYEQCFARLKNEWDEKLRANNVSMIPIDRDAYAQLVFAQSNYKNRSERELEAKAKGV